jgi:hypothetical protein
MNIYYQTFLGVGVSLGLFLIGYRQTIGARKERARSTNAEIEKILLRRVVLESWLPDQASVTRLIEGKARDYRVSTDSILSSDEALDTIFTRIIESDFITPDQRREILARLAPLLEKPKHTEIKQIISYEAAQKRTEKSWESLILLGLATSFLGAIAAFLFKYYRSDGEATTRFSGPVFTVFLLSLVAAMSASLFIRLRDSQSGSIGPVRPMGLSELTHDVAKVLRQYGADWVTPTADKRYDFAVDSKGKKVLVEVKSWRGLVPSVLIQRTVERLSEAIRSDGADEAIIVTSDRVKLPASVTVSDGNKIKLMTLKEMKKYLAASA